MTEKIDGTNALDGLAYERERADRAEKERDEATRKLGLLAEELTAESEARRGALTKLAMVQAHRDDVWRWTGDGSDESESLACPVVMSADTLRSIEADRDAARRERDEARDALYRVLVEARLGGPTFETCERARAVLR